MGKKVNVGRPVIVTTAHRGVFFGFADDTDGEQIALKQARLCLYWSADVKGFMGLDHLCRTRLCVNPEHLEAVTPRVNTMRELTPAARNAAKTHCPLGHSYDATNTRVDSKGKRNCRRCQVLHSRRYQARKRAEREIIGEVL